MADPSFQPSPRWLLILAAVYLLGHLYFITAPPNGYHQWRESDTTAVALNFYQEDPTFWEPRINQRGATEGITGMEFPLYNYAVSLLYHITGPSHAVARLFSLLCGAVAGLFFWLIAARLFDRAVALGASVAMTLSPLFWFYSGKIMPDILMFALWLGAIYWFIRWLQERERRSLVVSALLLAVAAAIKPLCLSVFLPLLILTWQESTDHRTNLLLFGAYMAVTFSGAMAWLEYAKWLQAQSGLGTFYLGAGLSEFYRHAFSEDFYEHLFFQWPWEMWVGWGLVPAFALGLYRMVRSGGRKIVFWWILSAYLVFALVSLKASTHDYYTIIILPPIALMTGLGLNRLVRLGSPGRVAAAILVVVCLATTGHRLWHRYVWPDDFFVLREGAEEMFLREEHLIVHDRTGAIRLYQLNRHGWFLRDDFTSDQILAYVDQGADWLLLEDSLGALPPDLTARIDSTPYPVGPLNAFRVRKNN